MFTHPTAATSRPSRSARPLCVLILAVGVLLLAPATDLEAESAQGAPALDDAAIERLRELHQVEHQDVRLVLLPAVVTNSKGRIVRGLAATDFTVIENRVPQEIRYFNTETIDSISIAFLLDLSGSMRQLGKLDEAKQAIRIFVEDLGASDRFGLVGFADEQVSWITDFTGDRPDFLRRLGVQEAYGRTALNDAVAATPGLVDDRVQGRKAIVLITDGIDNASRLSDLQAVQLARRVQVPIYIINFQSQAGKILQNTPEAVGTSLVRFAEETGGALFSVFDPDDLKEVVLRIQQEMRHQYVIGYRPAEQAWDGKFRPVTVATKNKRHVVRTRSGYYAKP